MKKILSIMLALILILGLAACDDTDPKPREMKFDSEYHWMEDESGNVYDKELHTGGEATTEAKAECEVCGAEYGELAEKPHTHEAEGEWKTDGENHWKVCECGEIMDKTAHTGGEATTEAKAKCEVCGAEYGELAEKTHTHEAEGEWKTDGENHWKVCECGEIMDKAAHAGGEATTEAKAKCEVCGAEYGELAEKTHTQEAEGEPEEDVHSHSPLGGWKTDSESHWQVCPCGEIMNKTAHSGGNATCSAKATCDICGAQYGDLDPEAHGETEIRDVKDPTDTEEGYTGDTYCKDCGEKISEGEAVAVLHTHSYSEEWKGDEENHWHECSCGEKVDTEAHTGGVATSDKQAVCDICGLSYGDLDPTNIVRKEGDKNKVYAEYKAEAEDKAYALMDGGIINGENLTAELLPLKGLLGSGNNSKAVQKNQLYIDSSAARKCGVYIGYNDWYFYSDSIEDYEGKNLFSNSELKKMLETYEKQYKYCESKGIKYYLSFAPNKNTVYPEYMYEGYKKADYTRLDQLIEYIRKNSDIPVIDLRTDLLEAKKENPGVELYHRMDTHWNQHAAFIATNSLLKAMQKDFPAVKLLDINNFAIGYMETYMKDQAWYLGYYDDFVQEAPQYVPLDGWKAKLTEVGEIYEGTQFDLAYVWDDGYSEGLLSCAFVNKKIPDAPSVVVFRDSFGAPMLKFIGESFSESAIYWEKFDVSLVSKHSPDAVIVEVAERFLDK